MPRDAASRFNVLTLQRFNTSTILCVFALVFPCTTSAKDIEWPTVGGDKGCTRYSALNEINRTNVSSLQATWTYHTGDSGSGNSTTIECTPIVIGRVMFITTAESKVVALDAATGRERWKYDPYAAVMRSQPRASGGVNRGVAHWSDGKQSRILLGVAGGRLISLDARTGTLDCYFGNAGTVD